MIELDGLRYEYDDVPGSDGRAPLLFLHEGLGSVGLWRGFHRRIAAETGRRTVAYSRLGHGRSDRPRDPRTVSFMSAEAGSVMPALCTALGLDRPVLVGHSDGATIALLAAASMPVSGVVVLAPHVLVEEFALAAIRSARDAFETGDLRARLARHHDDPDAVFRGWNDVWLAPGFRDWDVRDRLSHITAPVLGIQGDDDEQSPAPLMVIRVADLAEARGRVEAAGGVVTLEPFSFPGGRRFHFREPGGNEMAMWVPE